MGHYISFSSEKPFLNWDSCRFFIWDIICGPTITEVTIGDRVCCWMLWFMEGGRQLTLPRWWVRPRFIRPAKRTLKYKFSNRHLGTTLVSLRPVLKDTCGVRRHSMILISCCSSTRNDPEIWGWWLFYIHRLILEICIACQHTYVNSDSDSFMRIVCIIHT